MSIATISAPSLREISKLEEKTIFDYNRNTLPSHEMRIILYFELVGYLTEFYDSPRTHDGNDRTKIIFIKPTYSSTPINNLCIMFILQ